MNVLLDECVPWAMHRLFAGHACTSAQQRGWSDLLRLAEVEFDLFIPSDRNIRYQQNLAGRRIAIIGLSCNASAASSLPLRRFKPRWLASKLAISGNSR